MTNNVLDTVGSLKGNLLGKNALMTEKVKEFDSKELIRTFLIKPDPNRIVK